LAQTLCFKSVDELLASIGRGDTTVIQIAETFKEQVFPKKESLPIVTKSDLASGIQIQGVGGLLTQTAQCCSPVAYDSIVGYIAKGGV